MSDTQTEDTQDIPTITPRQFRNALNKRLERERNRRDKQIAAAQAETLRVKQMLLNQSQLIDAIRVVVRDEITKQSGENNE